MSLLVRRGGKLTPKSGKELQRDSKKRVLKGTSGNKKYGKKK